MVLLYLDIGKFLYDLKSNSGYGDKIVAKAAEFMKSNYPQLRGFTKRNFERMIQFYSTYKDNEFSEKNAIIKNLKDFIQQENITFLI